MKENRQVAAAKSLSRLTSLPMDHPSVQAELQDIRVALQIEREMGESTYKDCFRLNQNKTGLRTLSGIVILALQQLTGINFLFYCKALLVVILHISHCIPQTAQRSSHTSASGTRSSSPSRTQS